jgi:hypothetical protein
MQVNIQDMLKETGNKEKIYPGKRIVQKYAQPGEFKSHCVVFDWRSSDLLRVELKAGLLGKDLDVSELKKYPVSYQAPTYLELIINNDDDKIEEDEEEEGTKGKSGGGGGKKPAQKKLDDSEASLSAFEKVSEGQVSELADIKKFVVMGKELAQEAFAQAFDNLKEQLRQTKVMALDIMKNVGDIIKKATPGGGLEARGNESVSYKYDSEKTAALFGSMSPG